MSKPFTPFPNDPEDDDEAAPFIIFAQFDRLKAENEQLRTVLANLIRTAEQADSELVRPNGRESFARRPLRYAIAAARTMLEKTV